MALENVMRVNKGKIIGGGSGNGSVPSFVGMIVESTTLDTKVKVQNIYGADTDWIQHTGYILRGASSGVVANSATKTGGSDDAVVVSHAHNINSGWGSPGAGTITNEIPMYGKYLEGRGVMSTETKGESGTNKNIPSYKSVYIWERIN